MTREQHQKMKKIDGLGPGESGSNDQQHFRFVLPSLYAVAPNATGQVFRSWIGGHEIGVVLQAAEHHGEKSGTGATWMVPRSLELVMPADFAFDLVTADSVVGSWWRRVTDWLGAWLGVAPAVDVSLERRVQPLDESVSASASQAGVMRVYSLPNEVRATSSEVADALEFAGINASLPTAYQLLVHAQTARQQFDMRVCVIDASAAAEVAAGTAIERALTGQFRCPEAFVQATARSTRGLVKSYETSSKLGLQTAVDKGAVQKLAELRNSAVHAGKLVNEESADYALGIAQRMVRDLSGRAAPVPDPSQKS